MSNAYIRDLLLQSQPEVYRAGGDPSVKLDLQQAAVDMPDAVLDVLLDDLIWRLKLEEMVLGDETPALDQIVGLAKQGDFGLAYERTELAVNIERDRAVLTAQFRAAAQEALADEE
ncbi:MAG: hypothetical protein AAFV33_04470 [Chloroflexota bacterium]